MRLLLVIHGSGGGFLLMVVEQAGIRESIRQHVLEHAAVQVMPG